MSLKLVKVISHFKSSFDKVTTDYIETPVSLLSKEDSLDYAKRARELHPSSFPVCPLRMAYERLTVEDDPIVYRNFTQDYYLNVGTTAHLLLQYWFGRTGYLVGNWTCANCKTAYRFSVKPKKCRSCKHTEFLYHELGGKTDNIRWHTDGVYKIGDYYYVLDFKTTGDYQLDMHRKNKNVFPYFNNVLQLEGYFPLLEQKYNVKLSGWLLAYISRSRPMPPYGIEVIGKTVTDSDRDLMEERLERFKKAHTLSLKVEENPRLVLKKAMATKLCESRQMYEEKIKGYNPCPLSDVCFKKSALIKQLKEVI
jgi:hypothetical protein